MSELNINEQLERARKSSANMTAFSEALHQNIDNFEKLSARHQWKTLRLERRLSIIWSTSTKRFIDQITRYHFLLNTSVRLLAGMLALLGESRIWLSKTFWRWVLIADMTENPAPLYLSWPHVKFALEICKVVVKVGFLVTFLGWLSINKANLFRQQNVLDPVPSFIISGAPISNWNSDYPVPRFVQTGEPTWARTPEFIRMHNHGSDWRKQAKKSPHKAGKSLRDEIRQSLIKQLSWQRLLHSVQQYQQRPWGWLRWCWSLVAQPW